MILCDESCVQYRYQCDVYSRGFSVEQPYKKKTVLLAVNWQFAHLDSSNDFAQALVSQHKHD